MSPNQLVQKSARGFSLPLVLILTGVLVVATSAFLAEIVGSSRAGYMLMKRKQAFYVADGISRVVGRSAQTKLNAMEPSVRTALLNDPVALEQKILDLICEEGNGPLHSNTCCNTPSEQDPNGCCTEDMLPKYTPALFAVQCLKIAMPNIRQSSSIPGGPFQGMQSDIVEMSIQLTTVKQITGQLPIGAGNISASSNTNQKIILGDISALQFSIFAYDDTSIFYGSDMAVQGRTHINGNLCAGGNGVGNANDLNNAQFNQGPYMEQVTIAGRAYLLGAPDCIAPQAFRSELAVATNNSFSNFKVLDYDSRDTNWVTRSDTDFNGNIRDESHGIFHLQMPISLRRNVDNKVMHDGYNALAGEQNILAERFHSSNNLLTTDTDRNAGAFRLLIEPPYNNSKYADADDIKNQKLAHKADIRIINGIWFVRNQIRQSENNWPGVPIWSDHMGNYTAKGPKLGTGTSAKGTEFGFLHKDTEFKVGQTDLSNTPALSWNSLIPKRYSYYRWNPNTIFDPWDVIDPTAPAAPPAVISYGSLYRTQAGTHVASAVWHPGFWAQDNAFCDKLGALKPYTLLDDTFTMASVPSDPCEIRNDLYQNRELLGLLLGSRSGFQNPLAFQKVNPKLWSNLIVPDTASAQRVSAVFPINFDVNAFQEALADNTSGELGWIIQNIIPEGTFNGIIYIASSWPGIHDDFVDASTKAHPQLNPLGYEENSTAPTSTLFPYPLCGATERSLPTGGTPPKINRCSAATEQQTAISATNPTHIFPNALRIINGRNLRNDHRSVEANEYLPELSNSAKMSPQVIRLTEGLTISTNLPVYVLGDFNRNSYPSAEEVAENVSQAWPLCRDLDGGGLNQDCWIPTSIAGDHLTLLSNDWDDSNARFDSDPTTTLSKRNVTNSTVYNTSFLAGWIPSAKEASNAQNNGGIPNFPKFIETWSGDFIERQKAYIRGSLFIGWAAAHFPAPWTCCEPVYKDPQRQWRFDTRLNQTGHQPPGAPTLSIYSISQWARDE